MLGCKKTVNTHKDLETGAKLVWIAISALPVDSRRSSMLNTIVLPIELKYYTMGSFGHPFLLILDSLHQQAEQEQCVFTSFCCLSECFN